MITEDTKLDSDLECSFPFETALTIGADDVTLDLNGHTVRFDASIGTGIDNEGGYDRVTIRDGAVEGFEAAVRLEGATGNRLVNLRVRTAPNAAVVLAGSTGNVIRNSEFFSINQGLILTEGSDRNLVVGTSLRAGGGEGLIISDSDGNRIARNVFPFDVFGAVHVSGSQNEIVRNQVADTILKPGIIVREGSDNLILGNIVSTGPSDLQDGIRVEAVATDTLVRSNLATGNGDDGIDVESPSTTLSRNTANDNVDLGIEAVPGVIDGGRNAASGNGNPLLQCLNVFCR